MYWLTRAQDAEEFFKRVIALESQGLEDTRDNRLKIMADMAKERRVFKQTEEQVKKRLAGKKVLRVKSK